MHTSRQKMELGEDEETVLQVLANMKPADEVIAKRLSALGTLLRELPDRDIRKRCFCRLFNLHKREIRNTKSNEEEWQSMVAILRNTVRKWDSIYDCLP